MPLVAYYDAISLISDSQRRAIDGALVVRGRFARTGVQSYDNDDGTPRFVYRSEDEVRKSAPSFVGVTVTDLHPDGGASAVTPGRWRELARGHVQSSIYKDGWLEGEFYISDGPLAQLIETGERQELSAGYFAHHVEEPGVSPDGHDYTVRQTEITGNHVAVAPVGTARAGHEARLVFDALKAVPRSTDRDQEKHSMDDIEITIGQIDYKFKADSTAGQALRQELQRVPALEADRDKATARADAADIKVAKLEADLAEAIDPKRIEEMVTLRANLIAQATKIAPQLVTTDLGNTALRSAALEASGRKLEGRSDAYIEAAFDLAVETQQALQTSKGKTIADAVVNDSSTTSNNDDIMQTLWDAIDQRRAADAQKEIA